MKDKILSLVQSGLFEQARQECLEACSNYPGNAELWFILSAIYGQLDDFPNAEKYCKKAIDLSPSVPSAYYNLGIAQRRQGKLQDAIESLNRAVQLQETFIAAWYELGNVCLETGETGQAEKHYRKVLEISPDAYQAMNGLAIVKESSGELREAMVCCERSLGLNTAQVETVVRLARLYERSRNPKEAIRHYRRAIKLGCKHEDVYIELGRVHAELGETASAEKSYSDALAINQDSVAALSNLALLMEAQQNIAAAVDLIDKAVALSPEDEKLLYNRAKIYTTARRYTEAAGLYERVLDRDPEFTQAAINLGNILLLSGRVHRAQDIYSSACQTDPGNYEACSNMLMSLNYNNRYAPEEISRRHVAWGADAVHTASGDAGCKSGIGGRPLRVGFVSPDFRRHSVACFIRGILEHLDRETLSSYCYSDVRRPDDMTETIARQCDHWRDISGLDDNAAAALIRQDSIDVLFDLCGHFSGNRMHLFAQKPAPVQITYLGYPNTTGLPTIDYRIVDRHTDPEHTNDLLAETPLYLDPGFLLYRPYEESPEPDASPFLENGYVTFGSFNNLAKMSDEVIGTWSAILTECPESRLCIKARQFADSGIRECMLERFRKEGIDDSRLLLLEYSTTTEEHLRSYREIDIALDTFPYNGTTTTLEALWMGAPVIGLEGDVHAGRVGLSIMRNLDMSTMVARDRKQYIEIARELSRQHDELVRLRRELRNRVMASPLMNGEEFARAFESLVLATTGDVAKSGIE